MPIPLIGLIKGLFGKKALLKAAGEKAAEGSGSGLIGKVLSKVFPSLGKAETASPMLNSMQATQGSKADNLMELLQPKSGKLDNPLLEQARQYIPPIQSTDQGINLGTKKKSQLFQNLLSGESLGSKLFLNTMSNLGQSGAFSSELGRDTDFGGALKNSFASALGSSVGQQRKENFQNRQALLNMAQDLDYSKEIMQFYQPEMLKTIEGLKGELVGAMANNRKTGKNYLSSEEIQNFQWKYIDAKKQIDKFNSGIKQLQQAQEVVKGKANLGGVYSIEKFNWAVDQFKTTGEPPAEGFLYPNPQSPEEYASTMKVTDMTRWTRGGEGNFVKTSPLTNQQRTELLFADFAANPRVRAWYEEQGINIDDPETRYREAAKYAPQVEKPIPDYDAQMRWEEQQQDERQRAADKAQTVEDKKLKDLENRGWKEVPDYLGQGRSIVFDKAKTENIDVGYLGQLVGGEIKSKSGFVPVTLERVGEDGNLYLSYKTSYQEEDEYGKMKTIEDSKIVPIPMSKASGLVDTFYPGASEAAKNIKPKVSPSKTPMVYNNDMEDKIEMFMERNGIKDRDEAVSILREKKIL